MVEKTKKRILITGSSGMLGFALCRELSRDFLVTGLDVIYRKSCKSFIRSDITKKKDLFSKIIELSPHIIIHTAGYTDVDGCELNPKKSFKINELGTKYIAQISKKINAFLIFISTDYVFDGKKKRLYRESDAVNPCNVYGQSKSKAEKYIKSTLNNFLIIRTSRLFGEKGKNFVKKIVNLVKKQKELWLVSDQISSPTYTKDLAKACARILKMQFLPKGILHITNSGSCSWYGFAKESIKNTRLKNIKLIPISSSQFLRPSKVPAYSVLDNKLFRKITNYRMRSWQAALQDYLK